MELLTLSELTDKNRKTVINEIKNILSDEYSKMGMKSHFNSLPEHQQLKEVDQRISSQYVILKHETSVHLLKKTLKLPNV